MTTKEKIASINRVIDHLFCLSCQGKLTDDELQYLCDELRQLRQHLTELRSIELQEGDEK